MNPAGRNCQDPASTTPFGSTGNVGFRYSERALLLTLLASSRFRRVHTSGVLTLPSRSHFRRTQTSGALTLPAYSHAARTHTPIVFTCFAWVRCPRGIRHARRALHRTRTHMLCMVLSSSHMPCVGSLFSRYPSRLACSSSRPYSHPLRRLVVFSHALRGHVVLVVSVTPGVLFVFSVVVSCIAPLSSHARHGLVRYSASLWLYPSSPLSLRYPSSLWRYPPSPLSLRYPSSLWRYPPSPLSLRYPSSL